ncbi:MAG: fibronectin type III domain-containing protein, partial [Chitinophagales bacterium]|nr:fibronectin type III domain-containing protein [Chitinophagales bacterium]MDW8428045.1 fibronectin type III domain-containing protein [Chitinophagales bacterium]
MKAIFLFSSLLVLMTYEKKVYAQCALSAPSGFTANEVTSCFIRYSWNAVSGASGYELKYKLSTSSAWTKIDVGNTTAYTLSGLSSGTKYKAKVAARCSNGKKGAFSAALSTTTLACSSPQQLMASAVTSTSVTIGWSVPCGESTFTLNWRPQASSSWNTISDISVHSYTLSGLQPQTSYEVKVQSQCG